MAKILIKSNSCIITEESDTGFLWALDRELSFDVQGAKYMAAYRGYFNKDGQYVKWDGKQRLLKDNLEFSTGLLQRVEEFYKKDNRAYQLIDQRQSKTVEASIDIIKKLKALGKEPYPYQLETIEATKQRDHGIIRLATGGGKTIVAALMTANFGKKTIIYVIGKDLLYQIHQLFTSLFDQKIGIIGDGLCEIHDINVASIWTVGQAVGLKKSGIAEDSVDDEKDVDPQRYKDVRAMMQAAKVHIFDECHVAACKTIQEIANHINPEHIYGMSASPWRDDGADMLIECVLGKPIINISASNLISQGYLVKPIIKFLKVPPYAEKGKKHFQTIYKNYVVENEVRNSYIVKGAEKLVEQGYQTLVLYNSVQHGVVLFEELSKKLPCVLLSGKDNSETRSIAKQNLEDGKVNCIIASRIFDIGIDLPSLSGLVIASSGKSSVRALQRVGRVIRKHPGKKQAAILDFYDQAPFLKEHAMQRKKIYSSEPDFEVIWPAK